MRCRDCEGYLMEAREERLDADLERDLAAHVESCPRCRAGRNDWRRLQEAAAGLTAPRLSPALEERVRRLCHAEIERLERRAIRPSPSRVQALPGFFWPAFGVLLFLTVVTLIPGLKDFFQGRVWTYRTTLALVLVIQNVLTILFAPLILVRRPENGIMCV